MDHVMNEIVMTRDEMRALDERLSLLQERVQNILPLAIVRSSSPDLSLTAHTKDPVPDLEAVMGSAVTVHGSKILHRRFEIESPADFESENARLRAKLDALRLQIITTMRLARRVDKDCTFQLGSFAVLKYTDDGFKWWKLPRQSIPEILEIRRSPWKLSNLLAGCPPTWIIRGYNLQNATLKAASANRSETLKILHSQKMESGEDLFLCEEPLLLQHPIEMFKEQIYIYASTNFVEVEEGTTVRLQSVPINARKAYWISVLQGLVPSPWTMIVIGSLSLLTTLESTPFGKQDDLLPNVEQSLTFEHVGSTILLGTNSTQNSNFLKLGMVLYTFLQVYIFAIFIPNFFPTLWLLSRDFIWALGFDVPGFERTPTLEQAIGTGPSPTSLLYVEHFLDDTTNNPSPTIVPPGMPSQEEEDDRKLQLPDKDEAQVLNMDEAITEEVQVVNIDVDTKEEDQEEGNDIPGRKAEFHAVDLKIFLAGDGKLIKTDVKSKREEEGRLALGPEVAPTSEDSSNTTNHASPSLHESEVMENVLNKEETSTSISGPAWSSSRGLGLDSSATSSDRLNISGLNSLGNNGSCKTCVIVIAVEAHTKLQVEPFAYAYKNLVARKNCKVVVICCMSRLQDKMGVKRLIDLQTFGGNSKRKLDDAMGSQRKHLNYFLQEFRKQLNEIGVELDIQIYAGPKSHEILVEASKALRPHWVVIDKSFSSRKKEIKAGLNCNLVLITKRQKIEILQVYASKYLDPEYQREDRLSDELPEQDKHSGERVHQENHSAPSTSDSRKTKQENQSRKKSSWKERMVLPSFLWGGLSRNIGEHGTVDSFMEKDSIMQLMGMPQRFSYKELSIATGGFSKDSKLGQGGFGNVYEGVLPKYNIPVAVKEFRSRSLQGQKEFVAEISILSRLRHRNLIQILGWCTAVPRETVFGLLVYELMPNGSLDKALFGRAGKEAACLTWQQRYNIVIGTAAVLDYLHQGLKQQVIHRDIKSSNIMLDEDWNAKLGGFDLARLVGHQQAAVQTMPAGTYGYMAPEAFLFGGFTEKTDVFAFGVLILEVACGRQACSPLVPAHESILSNWVWDCYAYGNDDNDMLSTVDKRLEDYDRQKMKVFLIVGLLCTRPDPDVRPVMRHVVQMLAGDMPVPSLPASQPVILSSSKSECMDDLGGPKCGSTSEI